MSKEKSWTWLHVFITPSLESQTGGSLGLAGQLGRPSWFTCTHECSLACTHCAAELSL